MKVRRLFQNIIVKEKIAKIAFLMKDVHCPCTQLNLKAHSAYFINKARVGRSTGERTAANHILH